MKKHTCDLPVSSFIIPFNGIIKDKTDIASITGMSEILWSKQALRCCAMCILLKWQRTYLERP